MGEKASVSSWKMITRGACFYLSELKLSTADIGKEFNMTVDQVEKASSNYKAKIDSGNVNYDQEAKAFWLKNLRESSWRREDHSGRWDGQILSRMEV